MSNTTETTTTNNTIPTLEEFNKKITRTIFFKDRMIFVNDQLKAGKTEQDLEMSVFEIELRSREGNFAWVKKEDGQFVKLFSWELIKRSIEKIRTLRNRKAELCDSEAVQPEPQSEGVN